MKKVFTLFAALMMLSASAETLSLYGGDGQTWSSVIPFNGLWMDEMGIKTQVLYPAADLQDMVGKEITAITFYTQSDGCPESDVKLTISLGETTVNAMSAYITEGMTQVGTLTFTQSEGITEITVNFDTPYTYNGGNLVFEDVVTEAASKTQSIYMTGIEVNYNCSISWSYGSATPRTFMPQTTFTYGGGDTPEPEYEIGDVNHDHNVNIADVTALIDLLLSGGEAPAEADVNGDQNVNIADVTALIDKLLSGN